MTSAFLVSELLPDIILPNCEFTGSEYLKGLVVLTTASDFKLFVKPALR